MFCDNFPMVGVSDAVCLWAQSRRHFTPHRFEAHFWGCKCSPSLCSALLAPHLTPGGRRTVPPPLEWCGAAWGTPLPKEIAQRKARSALALSLLGSSLTELAALCAIRFARTPPGGWRKWNIRLYIMSKNVQECSRIFVQLWTHEVSWVSARKMDTWMFEMSCAAAFDWAFPWQQLFAPTQTAFIVHKHYCAIRISQERSSYGNSADGLH